MADHAHRDIDKVVDDAQTGGEVDACAKAEAKVARQPKGSARKRMAERQLAACHAAQTTDSNN